MKKLLLLSVCLSTFLSGCVIQRGMHVRTGEYRQPTSFDSVRIYAQEPTNYKVLGLVRGEGSHAFVSDQHRMDKAIERMKQEAAALGANGVIIQSAGNQAARSQVVQQFGNMSVKSYGNQAFGQYNSTSVGSNVQDAVVNGVAIWVDGE